MTKTKTTVPNRSRTLLAQERHFLRLILIPSTIYTTRPLTHTINEEKTILALLFVDWMYCWKTAAKKDCCFSHRLFDIFKHIFNKCGEKHVFVVAVDVVSTHTHSPPATPPWLWREAAGKKLKFNNHTINFKVGPYAAAFSSGAGMIITLYHCVNWARLFCEIDEWIDGVHDNLLLSHSKDPRWLDEIIGKLWYRFYRTESL